MPRWELGFCKSCSTLELSHNICCTWTAAFQFQWNDPASPASAPASNKQEITPAPVCWNIQSGAIHINNQMR